MQVTINLHSSWTTIPHALARILASLATLERTREPGEDLDDLSELLAGMNDPEPQPAPQPVVSRPSPAPAAATPPANGRTPRAFDGIPTTGKSLYAWATTHK